MRRKAQPLSRHLLGMAFLCSVGAGAHAATPPGTLIENLANATFTVGGFDKTSFTSDSNTDQIVVQPPPAVPVAVLALAVSPTSTHPGDTLALDVTITNTGIVDVPPGELTFPRPAGSTLALPPGWTVVDQSGTSLISIPGIPVGGSVSVPMQLVLALSTPTGTLPIDMHYSAGGLELDASQSVEVAARTQALLEPLRHGPTSAIPPVTVPLTQYFDGGVFTVFPPPLVDGLAATGPLKLVATSVIRQGYVLFARLTDPDQNKNPAVAESIVLQAAVVLPDSSQVDTETFLLGETGPDTGVFMGYLQTSAAAQVPFDGLLEAPHGSTVTLRYQDAVDGQDVTLAGVLVDPFGKVFDSATGSPVNGVSVALIDADTDAPATVYGDDGVSTYPSTVVTGSTVTDGGGTVYDLPDGGFRFPLVPPGNYRFEVQLPASSGFSWPSTVATAVLQALPGGPFAIDVGSRGEPFVVEDGPPLNLDLPLDPSGLPLWVRKSASKTDAAAGDFVQYRVEVQSTRAVEPVQDVVLTDALPPGFRYEPGSARVDGAPAADPTIGPNGRTLVFHLGDLAPLGTITVTYVTRLAAVRPGDAVNRASAAGAGGAASNTAQSAVRVREELFRSTTILVGQVVAGEPGTKADQGTGVPGVRIYLEDGTYVVTDERGMFHFEGLRPGVHVVQLDLDTLPPALEVLEQDGDLGGRAWSKFVDVQGGSMWRVDFPVAPKPVPQGNVSLSLESTLAADGSSQTYRLELTGSGVPIGNARLTVLLPEGAAYVRDSSRLDGTPLPDPEVTRGALTYRLGDRPADWHGAVTLTATVDATAHDGELASRATLFFDTPTGESQRTPVASNLLLTRRNDRARQSEEFTVRPQFDSMSTSLRDDDRPALRDLVSKVEGLQSIRLQVIGYADDKLIRYRSWEAFPDNLALSRARADAVARFLEGELGLAPASMSVLGLGEQDPIADNGTEDGRAQNRRVEVRVIADRPAPRPQPEGEPKVRDTQSVEFKGLRPGETPPQRQDAAVAPPASGDEDPARYGGSWIETAPPGLAWVLPTEGRLPRIPSVHVGIKHAPSDTIELYLNGAPVSRQNFEQTIRNTSRTVAFSLWLGVDLVPGDNRFEAVARGADGTESGRLERVVHYPGPPVRGEWIASRSTLIADGLTVPVIAVRFFDRDGFPAREDSTGALHIAPPYKPKSKSPYDLAVMPGAPPETPHYTIGPDGVALIELQPTTEAGDVKLVIPLQNGDQEIVATLAPQPRDWILVGLAEGTVGYNTIHGNMEPLGASAAEDQLYHDGRVALYAKGRVKGAWLLTLAYDSAKRNGPQRKLYGTIDPGTYYTLYGDRTTQLYDAASGEKLYLKIERNQFFALFGDFDTGLSQTELARYSRSLTGLKSRYADERYEMVAFASDSHQSFVKDEIRGEGITGPYPLSRRDLVLNSEKVTLQVRDRFQSQVVLEERALTRHLDYDIDYVAGSLIFRESISSTDEAFNPTFIVVDYESFDPGDHALTFGGRGQIRVDEHLQVGATHVTEGRGGGDATMNGADVVYSFTPDTKVRVEYAHTGGAGPGGQAYLAEAEHRSASGGAKAYYREQDEGFGLGQINRSETGTRKAGVEGSYHLTPSVALKGQAFRQDNLATDGTREVLEAETVLRLARGSLHGGLRSARDDAPGEPTRSSDLLTAGGAWKLAEGKLGLSLDREQPLGEGAASTDYPARTRLGLDYLVAQETSVFLAQEWADGADRDSQNTKLGVKSTPWRGGEVSSSLTRTRVGAAEADATSVALRQKWELSRGFSLDAGIERVLTSNPAGVPPMNGNVPFAGGSIGDSVATSLGATYNPGKWLWNARLDYRNSDSDDRRSISTSAQTDPRSNLSLLVGLQALDHTSAAGEDDQAGSIRVGLAYRPPQSRWLVLEKLEWIEERRSGTDLSFRNARAISNLNANYRVERWQSSLQYGAKFARETIDGVEYDGYTDLTGVEIRRELTPRWDVGLRASVLHAWSVRQLDESYGVSIGRDLMRNVWISAGYNFAGFEDRDFSAADATSRGPFVTFRMKFDQQSLADALHWIARPAPSGGQ